jgi:hypothetical protein
VAFVIRAGVASLSPIAHSIRQTLCNRKCDSTRVDIRERHIGTIATRTSDGLDVTVNVGAFVWRLLLFEHCTLESDRLQEIHVLIRVFGVKGIEALLESDAFSIIGDAATMGSVGQIGWLKSSLNRGGPCRWALIELPL